MKGEWQDAAVLLQRDPQLASAEITGSGDTALHMAAATRRTKFVKELVKMMSGTELLSMNKHGYTAFCYAAASGIVELAAVMLEKNKNLLTTRGNKQTMPLQIAASLGHKEMVSYLYKFIRVEDLSITEWFNLLIATIRNNMHDIALNILEMHRSNEKSMRYLVLHKDGLSGKRKKTGTALHQFVVKDISDSSSAREEAILKRFLTIFAAVRLPSRCKRIFEQPLMQRKNARLVAERLWSEMLRLEDVNLFEVLGEPAPILHEAAKVGNVGLISMLTLSYPDLIWQQDNNKRYIFHTAVLHRQENVFSLIHQIGSMKELIAIAVDDNNNNILHLAGN
ncbi:hypothetical protein Salat_0370400 [Sesamum alatum]|uniref:Uncharacterized protein n=1 Tax=Sesamum alatum TaxID=300844 RepID=A0AAE1Z144_9LAMI|nr:hypothetical protein Salat_0370400 [Sesamum alatum]